MDIEVKRNDFSDIYCGGELLINGNLFCSTVEWNSDLLDEGYYAVVIRNGEIYLVSDGIAQPMLGANGAIHCGSWREGDFLYDERAVMAKLSNLIDDAIDSMDEVTLVLTR